MFKCARKKNRYRSFYTKNFFQEKGSEDHRIVNPKEIRGKMYKYKNRSYKNKEVKNARGVRKNAPQKRYEQNGLFLGVTRKIHKNFVFITQKRNISVGKI